MKTYTCALLLLSGLLTGCSAKHPSSIQTCETSVCEKTALLNRAGFSISSLNSEQTIAVEMAPERRGVLVSSVDPKKSAWAGGLRENMVILYINHQATPTPEDFSTVISPLHEEDFLLVRVRIPHYGNRHLIIRLK